MRRRPMELWWIAGFCLLTALWVFALPVQSLSVFDRSLLRAYGAGLLAAAVLVMSFSRPGRWLGFILLGIEAADHGTLLVNSLAWPSLSAPFSVAFLAFSAWMLFYLQRPSTARLFAPGGQAPRVRTLLCGLHVIDLLEVLLALGPAWLLLLAGLPAWAAGVCAIGAYALYSLFLEEWVRRRWAALFARLEAGFPAADAARWRAARNAMARNDLAAARRHLAGASEAARLHPAGRLFLQMLDWYELLGQPPADGRSALRRAAFDHDWQPRVGDGQRLEDCVECASAEALRALADERAALIEGLVQAGLNSGSFFYNRADRVLTRITGAAFAFNTHESWAAWWDAARPDWTGDSGLVALAARLLHHDAYPAANLLAQRIAARTEEPLLKEVTAQILFLHSMQKALKDREGLHGLIEQPLRMLLIPELADIVGLLHGDSTVLAELGLPPPQVRRRLLLRVTLIDYTAKLWRRYPLELDADMPGLLAALAGRRFSLLRARAQFEMWWPKARPSLLHHDRAVAAGLAALTAGDETTAEKCFNMALKQQPRELSSRYNLAICATRRHDHQTAARLLRELTLLEPREPYWWMVLGDIHRSVNKTAEAYAAFRRALELGAAEGRVAWHLGLTFARDKRDAEAIQQLDRALGKNPSLARLEKLASELESEGLWNLAGHYRDQAFRRGLRRADEGAEERDGDAVG